MKINYKRKRRHIVDTVRFTKFIVSISLLILLFVYLFTNACFTKTNASDDVNQSIRIINDADYAYECEEITTLEITEDMHLSDVVEKCNNESIDDKQVINKPDNLNDEYYQIIVDVANNENISKEILLAIITTENQNYDVSAKCYNSNGTVDMGLCQINSAYVDYYADTYNIENLDPYNVTQAVTFVARHMKYLSNYAKENYQLSEKDSYIFAAGAYNRGLGAEIKHRNMYEYKEKFINNYEKFAEV